MQLQMTSQRYDRQQQQQHDQSPERVSKMNPEFHYPTEIQERQYQQRTRNRDGMSKAGSRRMSSGSINDSATGAAKTTPLHSRRDRDDCCHLHSPPSSPRPHGTTTPSAPASPSQRNGRAGHRLSLSIPRLLRSDWVSLEGLVSCALSCLRKEECTRISELGKFCDVLITICLVLTPITFLYRPGMYLILHYVVFEDESFSFMITDCAGRRLW
ncbi:hypothetical protein K440DRAFT_127535 [Wilcoxina mikolae CBS 423.85]|nr:hypothetical protein K440DRAFT_127535 [Wilcoxina mikolae CBS 423.85]